MKLHCLKLQWLLQINATDQIWWPFMIDYIFIDRKSFPLRCFFEGRTREPCCAREHNTTCTEIPVKQYSTWLSIQIKIDFKKNINENDSAVDIKRLLITTNKSTWVSESFRVFTQAITREHQRHTPAWCMSTTVPDAVDSRQKPHKGLRDWGLNKEPAPVFRSATVSCSWKGLQFMRIFLGRLIVMLLLFSSIPFSCPRNPVSAAKSLFVVRDTFASTSRNRSQGTTRHSITSTSNFPLDEKHWGIAPKSSLLLGDYKSQGSRGEGELQKEKGS